VEINQVKVQDTSLEEQIFDLHHRYYKNIGVETIKQQAGQVEQVSSDYQGRVIYELLQNAFDKADKNILVEVKNNCLYVGNDGKKFNYVSNYDYLNGNSKRGDFQSLCSISTSTKKVSTSIGNKGVGFKSAFSVAEEGFVSVYTHGEILDGEKVVPEIISFRLYDTFKQVDLIPSEFSIEIRENIKKKLSLVHTERPDRGIPGYYFPLHLSVEPSNIKELFKQGFVTIIEIPLASEDEVKSLFHEIYEIHFQFIQLKYKNDFKIRFVLEDEEEKEKFIDKDSERLFSTVVESDKLNSLAEAAGIEIKNHKIGFYIKDEPHGLLYNYLPTRVKSPFKYIDFHADFHTTVDRTAINFSGKVGDYNKALLEACLEFYFLNINKLLRPENRSSLNLIYIDNELEGQSFQFNWQLIAHTFPYNLFDKVRKILSIGNNSYTLASNLLSNLAQVYFENSRNKEEHELFFKYVTQFINYFSRNDGDQYKWVDLFKEELSKQLRQKEVRVIPNVTLGKNKEILFRKTNDSNIELPSFLDVNVTDFDVKDTTLKKGLGIKDFNDYNEILKYFKQCTFTGEFNSKGITENEQKDIIRSIYELYLQKKEISFLSTHRYLRAFTKESRNNNSTLNQAKFNCSTVFLKLSSGRYKPAQLCKIKDIDISFLDEVVDQNDLEEFLSFLGVSTDSEYIFCDLRLHKVLNKGLNYIPSLLNIKEDNESISSSLVENVRIISNKGEELYHPALINNNSYSFLNRLTKPSIRKELQNLLVGRYASFPESYLQVLKDRMSNHFTTSHKDVMRLYQNTFYSFSRNNSYLIINNNVLSWTNQKDFIIINNKRDFESCVNVAQQNILCYYSGLSKDHFLFKYQVEPVKGDIYYDNEILDIELKEQLENRIQYLLVQISLSNYSEVDYLSDQTDIEDLQHRIENLKILNVKNLKQEISFGENLKITPERKFAYQTSENVLLLESTSTAKEKAEAIGQYVFRNSSIKELIELSLFYKSKEELDEEVDHFYLDTIRKIWKKDYVDQWNQFQKEILTFFDLSPQENWFLYTRAHKSPVLIEISRQNRLEELKSVISQLKQQEKYNSYFDDFQLLIDYRILDDFLAPLYLLAEQNSDDSLLKELNEHSKYLLSDLQLEKLKEKVRQVYPDLTKPSKKNITDKSQEIDLQRRTNDILKKFSSLNSKDNEKVNLEGSASLNNLIVNQKKVIFLGKENHSSNSVDLETMGASGEEEVLIYYIENFLELPIEERKKGIIEVYNTLQHKVPHDSHKPFRDRCLDVIENKEELRKALIPFFYITMHYKFSYFDLIVYTNNTPTLIEVKTTNSRQNNKFYISIAEVNAARGVDAYEIVRNTPDKLLFLGNPIKDLDDKLHAIHGDNFILEPRNFVFHFNP
jgi:hypothetical protein